MTVQNEDSSALVQCRLYVDINEPRWGVGVENAAQGQEQASRTDLRFGTGPDERCFLLNKHDGTIREVVPEG